MPGNIQSAVPSGLMPFALCTAFSESRECAQLQAQYHDGTTDRSQLAQTSRRSFNPNYAHGEHPGRSPRSVEVTRG
jgi:hypothetical protein